MNDDDPIRSILIVGGGPAGWMTALYLSRFRRFETCRIVVMEAADLGTSSVGESTTPRLIGFLRNLRLDETAFMRACHATYKLGIRFSDWQGAGHDYWHPYGQCGGSIDGVELFHPWLRAHRLGTDTHAYADYSLQALAAQAQKAPRPLTGSSAIIDAGGYAFHLDPAGLAAHLRAVATGEGVIQLFDALERVDLVPDGDRAGAIAGVHTKAGRDLTADLYIDCTGAPGLLIEGALGDPWIDWSDLLLCDRTVLAPLPRNPAPPPYTQASALPAGWGWRIPLSHRVGAGYVYSSRHCDDAAAAAQLLSALPPPQRLGAVPRFLRLRVGRRSACWSRNCVAIGPAAGALEPLESTGLFFVQLAIEGLMEHFPDRRFEPILTRDYNRMMGQVFDAARDFVLLHYLLAGGDGSPFWRDARAVRVPDSLAESMERYDATGRVLTPDSPFQPTSYHFIYSGNGRLPRRPSPQVNRIDPAEAQAILDRILVGNRELADRLPSHRALIELIHERTW